MDGVKEFKLDIDGEEKTVVLSTRLELPDLGLEYGYCYEKSDNDTDETEKDLIAFRIRQESDGTDSVLAITSEKERQFAYSLYKRSIDEAK